MNMRHQYFDNHAHETKAPKSEHEATITNAIYGENYEQSETRKVSNPVRHSELK